MKGLTEEQIDRIVYLYGTEATYREIALELNIAERTVANKVLVLKKAGRLPDVYRSVDKANKRKTSYEYHAKQRTDHRKHKAEIEALGLHYCDSQTARKCIYGTSAYYEKQGLCNYILCTGKRRGCPATACDKFVEAKTPKDKLYKQQM